MSDRGQEFSANTASMAKTFMYRGFDPEEYARAMAAQSDGDKDLIERRENIRLLNDETSMKLKKQVYLNYRQFIEAAREISALESEMFRINHILQEQKTTMDSITKLFSEETFQEAEKRQQKSVDENTMKHKALTSLVSKVEGCAHVITPGRYLVHDGDVTELNQSDFSVVGKMRLFLLNDALLIAKANEERQRNRKDSKLKFQALFPLNDLGMVNARDIGPTKNAFKILIFPDSRLFQCTNAKEKRQWLEIVEEHKKKFLNQQSSPAHAPTIAASASVDKPVFEKAGDNPFGGSDSEGEEGEQHAHANQANQQQLPAWILEAPEEIDVLLAQRDFVQAQKLLLKCEMMLKREYDNRQCDTFHRLVEKRGEIVNALSNELCPAADRALRAGPRGQRIPAQLLIELGEERKAARLFLRARHAAQKYAQKSLLMEGNLVLHTAKFCRAFFDHLHETAKEFGNDFENKIVCFSSLVVWTRDELKDFVEQFASQVFQRNAELSEQAECVESALHHAEKLTGMGLDVQFLLNHQLRRHVVEAIIENRKLITEATNRKVANEEWRPLNLQTSTALEKLKEEMSSLGLASFSQYCKEPCFVRLTQSMVSYTRAVVPHCSAALKMYSPELYHPIIDSITELLRIMTTCVGAAINNIRDPEKGKLIRRTGKFLALDLIPTINQMVKEKTNQEPKAIMELQRNFLSKVPG